MYTHIHIYRCTDVHFFVLRCFSRTSRPRTPTASWLNFILKKTIKLQLSHIISTINDENSAV